MKLAVIVAVALDATAVTAALILPYVRTVTRTPKYKSNAKRISLQYGPLVLHGVNSTGSGSMDPHGSGGIKTIKQNLPKQSTILSAHWALRYANQSEAKPATGVYIHHFTSSASDVKGTSPFGGCMSLTRGSTSYFSDRGEDSGATETMYTTSDGKFNGGFKFGPRTEISVNYDIVNYKEFAQSVLLELTLEYLPGNTGKDVGASLKSVQGCGLPSGISLTGTTSSGSIPVKRDASILWARGHLHAGGTKMTMKINNKLICTSVPTYDADNVITAMSLCPSPIHIKKGDKITITSFYDTTKHDLRKATDGKKGARTSMGGSDVMGMMAMTYT